MNQYEQITTGTLLITHPQQDQQLFHETVILVLEHSTQGTHGLILNRPAPITVNSIITSAGQLAAGHSEFGTDDLVYQGGPVFKHSLYMLHTPDWQHSLTEDLTEDLSVTSGIELLSSLAEGSEPWHWRCFFGSCAWGPGQLEMEFDRAQHWPHLGWLTADYPGVDWIFEQDHSVLYTAALSLGTHHAVSSWI
jgi:putative transcriptional regulator